MFYMQYDFDTFLNSIKYLDKEDILVTTYKKHKSLDKSSPIMSTEFRLDLQNSISGLLYWLERGERPSNMREVDFIKLKPICESLIRKEQMDSSVLRIFEI